MSKLPPFIAAMTEDQRVAFCSSLLRMVDALMAAGINKDDAIKYHRNLLKEINKIEDEK